MHSLALAAFSALLGAVSQPNELVRLGLWPIGFVALAPLYLSLLRARTPGEAAASGAVYGALHHATTSYWLWFYKGYAIWTLGATTLAYAVVFAVAGLYASLLMRGSRAARPFMFALFWAMLEFLKSSGFAGYPWGLVAYAMTDLPVMLQVADITGVYGVSALLALTSAVAAELSLRRAARSAEGPRLAAAAVLCTVLVASYGAWRLSAPIPVAASFRALLVQQDTDPWISGENAALTANIRLARAALEDPKSAGRAPDLIAFSETSLRRPYAEFTSWFGRNPANDPLLPFITSSGAWLLTGAPVILDWDTYAASNSVLLIDPQGRQVESYAKMHGVPFAETMPLWEFAWFRTFIRDVVGIDQGWVMGTRRTVFTLDRPGLSVAGKPGVRFATPICFEDAFADLCRSFVNDGADLLVNLTNDSWSRRESAQLQHWAVARIRSIELRRTLVRSTNAGVSCVIDAWGRNIVEFPQFTPHAAVVDIPVYRAASPTVYAAFGDWFAIAAMLLSAGRIILLLLKSGGSWPAPTGAFPQGARLERRHP